MPPLTLAVFGGGASPAIEERLFAKLRLPNGTWKTTYPGRLDDLNELLLESLPREGSLELMDAAISSGVSTVEWSEHLDAHGVEHRIVAGDILTEADLTNVGARLALLCAAGDGEPLLLEVGPVSLPVRSERRLVKVARPLLKPALRRLGASAGRGGGRRSLLRRRRVPLVAAAARQSSRIEIVEDDLAVAGRYEGRFDAIRVANLLQPAYFSQPAMRRMAVNLRERLRDGGLLAICQTVDGAGNQATVFRRQGKRFEEVASLGGGAPVRELLLST